MEHVSTTTLDRGHRRMNGAPQPLATLPDLIAELEQAEAHELPDTVLPMNTLHMADDGAIVVPERGIFYMNDWSRKQASSRLGLRWDRWFENASGRDVAEEVNRRFARANGDVRLRLRREPHREGELRAFVTPGYSPVRDSIIARMLMRSLEHVEDRFRILRSSVTAMTTTFVVAVGEPYRVGGPGNVGDIWGGILIRNSGVGFASLLVSLHLTRLLCRNGMTAPVDDATAIRKVHRALNEKKLEDLLFSRLRHIPARLRRAGESMARAAELPIANVEDAMHDALAAADLPRRLLPALLAAYAREPHPSMFGISQAMTLAAQSLSPEERHELETAAGEFLVRHTRGVE